MTTTVRKRAVTKLLTVRLSELTRNRAFDYMNYYLGD